MSKLLCLNHTVQLYILVPCGANTDVNHYENCVLPITIFFRKLTHQARDCSASYVFVSRKLPTCKMLIRRNVYGFMLNVQKSNNLILNSIVHCDIVYCAHLLCGNTGDCYCIYTRSIRKPHSNSTLCMVYLYCNFLSCNMNIMYPQ